MNQHDSDKDITYIECYDRDANFNGHKVPIIIIVTGISKSMEQYLHSYSDVKYIIIFNIL